MVNAIPVKGNLGQLRESLEALRGLDLKSDKASQLSDTKYEQLKAAIADYEARLPTWEASLQALGQLDQASKLVKELTVATTHYDGAPEAAQHARLLERAEALSGYFQQVSTKPMISTPDNVTQRREVLEALRQSFQDTVTGEQLAQIEVALSWLDAEVQTREAQASTWLTEMQQRFQNGKIQGLEKVLASPPPFWMTQVMRR